MQIPIGIFTSARCVMFPKRRSSHDIPAHNFAHFVGLWQLGSSSEPLSGSAPSHGTRRGSSAAQNQRSADNDRTAHANYNEGSRTWGDYYAAGTGSGRKPAVDSDNSESFASKRSAERHAYYSDPYMHTRLGDDSIAEWGGNQFGLGKHEFEQSKFGQCRCGIRCNNSGRFR